MKFLVYCLNTAVCVAIFFAGCGGEAPGATPESQQAQSDNARSTAATAKEKQVLARRTIKAEGKTSDGKPASLSATVVQNSITGNLNIDNRSLQLSGMMDGNTLRCWISGDGSDTFRGNLIGAEKEGALQADFILSNSAGEKVIKGTVAN